MCDDYIPIDQAVIDQEVERLAQKRRSAKIYLVRAIKDAGGNFDIIAFRDDRRRIAKALDELRIFWSMADTGELLASRHEIYDVIYDRPRD